ncbi:hypothetical protein M422DRAFT_192869 [Sphaerobolus stellatus SS14]|uniref:Cytochrome P450 n=1 Tax=Sphaerobolus stellatus (strain SS14) TaxID=990650 RepID=A0A0C9TVS0_SPHS4|nr:hypothetical protein M422DRAFT_192869 [Sphaerobolus stellatus SS14]
MSSSLYSLFDSLTTTDILVSIACLTSASFAFASRQKKPLPPGPPRLPVLGNVLQMPKKEEWITYAEWAKKYGYMAGSPMIILNTWKAVRDLGDNRSANYSNRPHSTWNDLWVLSLSISLAAHRIRRSLVQRYFTGSAALKHRVHQQEEAHILLWNLLTKPSVPLKDHIKQHAASSVLLGSYGYRVSHAHDDLVKEVDKTFEYSTLGPSATSLVVDTFPILQHYPLWMPFSGFRRYADIVAQVFAEVRLGPYNRSRRMIEDGTGKPSFVSTSVEELEADRTSLSVQEAARREELIIDCASVMYGAGVDSTSASMGTFFALMSMSPEVIKRAQAEIDAVTNGERLPTFDDKERLPFVTAIYLEVLRHNTVTPLGIPHQVVKDDMYGEIFLPGGAMIVANMWYIFRDPEVFVDPHAFKPERFLDDKKGQRCREVLNIVWGYGRRACPGRQLAEASLFIAMASVLCCFDLTPSIPDPKLEYTSGFVRKVYFSIIISLSFD